MIRYDNIVHTFGSLMATFAMNTMFFSYSRQGANIKIGFYYIALILMAMGIGVINEIVEFITVLFLNAEEQVGGYINNTVDLVYNLIGSLIAIIILDLYNMNQMRKEKK